MTEIVKLIKKFYLASLWRNPNQPQAVQMLRDAGHEVYDFRNPPHGSPGFAWSPIDPATSSTKMVWTGATHASCYFTAAVPPT